MSTPQRWWRAVSLVAGITAGVSMGACMKKAGSLSPGSAPPTMAMEAEAAAEPADAGAFGQETIDGMEADLAELEAQLVEVGVSMADDSGGDRPQSIPADATERCTKICELATATCDLRNRICALAAEHDRQPRYLQACERAQESCEIAQAACTDNCPEQVESTE